MRAALRRYAFTPAAYARKPALEPLGQAAVGGEAVGRGEPAMRAARSESTERGPEDLRQPPGGPPAQEVDLGKDAGPRRTRDPRAKKPSDSEDAKT